MTNRSAEQASFPGCKGRRVEAEFSGGNVTSDGGLLLVRQADRLLGLTAAAAQVLNDPRRRASCRSQPTQHASPAGLRLGVGL